MTAVPHSVRRSVLEFEYLIDLKIGQLQFARMSHWNGVYILLCPPVSSNNNDLIVNNVHYSPLNTTAHYYLNPSNR